MFMTQYVVYEEDPRYNTFEIVYSSTDYDEAVRAMLTLRKSYPTMVYSMSEFDVD